MDTNNSAPNTNSSPTDIQQGKSSLNKTAIAITGIIAVSLLAGFTKYIDAKYGHETDFSYEDGNINIHYATHSVTNPTKQCQA